MKKLRKDMLEEFLRGLSKEYIVVAPVKNEKGFAEFKCVNEFKDISLEKNTLNSIKEFFFPQNEKLFTYKDGEIIENVSEKKMLIFGARACDVRSAEVLDKVFLDPRFTDVYYKNRRDNTVIIGYSCPGSEPGCFCRSLGIDPVDNIHSDLVLFEDAENYYIKVNNLEISDLVKHLEDIAPEVEVFKGEHNQKFSTKLQFPLDQKLLFNAPIWDDIFKKCLGCGTCTYLCPTCHCFEFYNRKKDECIEQYRCWDSCQYSLFTEHASGHNPRDTQKGRIRQRVMHKFSYYPKNYNVAACVGCGRCIRKCPVTLDMREVLGKIENYIAEGGVSVDE